MLISTMLGKLELQRQLDAPQRACQEEHHGHIRGAACRLGATALPQPPPDRIQCKKIPLLVARPDARMRRGCAKCVAAKQKKYAEVKNGMILWRCCKPSMGFGRYMLMVLVSRVSLLHA